MADVLTTDPSLMVGPPIKLDAERARRARPRPRQPASNAPVVSNERIAITIVIAAETMLFSAMIGAYVLFRYSTPVWPPPGLPSLPLGVTWANTVVLMVSGLTMLGALRSVRRDDTQGLMRGLAVTAILGAVFLAVQGSEWVRLVNHGLTVSTGPYGTTFYVLIGMHGVHVLGAMVWLAGVAIGARQGRYDAQRFGTVEMCAVYWFYVCALWIVLFSLVYQ